jgi:hypothetical protein
MMMIIAKRVLRIVDGEHEIEVPVTISMPVEDDRAWRCDYEVGWPHKPRRWRALGVDSVQALQLAMLAIGTELWANPFHHAGQLVFEDGDPSYGFPAELPRQVGREHTYRGD